MRCRFAQENTLILCKRICSVGCFQMASKTRQRCLCTRSFFCSTCPVLNLHIVRDFSLPQVATSQDNFNHHTEENKPAPVEQQFTVESFPGVQAMMERIGSQELPQESPP